MFIEDIYLYTSLAIAMNGVVFILVTSYNCPQNVLRHLELTPPPISMLRHCFSVNELYASVKDITASLTDKFNVLRSIITILWQKTALKLGEGGLSQIFCGRS